MNQITGQKLLAWCAFAAVMTCIGFGWMAGDVPPDARMHLALKLGALLLATVGICAALWQYSASRIGVRIRALEEFAADIPNPLAGAPNLSNALTGPIELEPLARGLQLVSDRVRNIIEHANLEVSRREAILACMAEGVLAVDGNLNVVFCNGAFAEAFNINTPVTEGRMLFEVVREPVLRDVLGRVVKNGLPEAIRVQLPSAGSRWFEARALPLASSASPKARTGALIVLHDITDIQHQEQLRKDFVADVSHELRTPLAAIRGFAETLLEGALEDEANNRRFVEIILSHAIRLNNIASDLLVLSEIDANSDTRLPPERISMLEVVDSAVNSVQNAASLKQVKILRGDCSECFVMGYRFRLEQAISNLLDNAVKFNRPGGTVEIEFGPDNNGFIQISVSDTGVGIPHADLKRIFERFYRVDKARARATGGTGLGLPIVKEVVERMDGTVLVESQLGKGSKFIIRMKSAPDVLASAG
ncbi:MAG TPA: ATP-binding protein [Bryobacteraceae bacterium]|nr:ATP-binding protein [Bryobacteraceae bacterium]